MQLPSLANSLRTSFEGVSEDDVELIQVRFAVARRSEICIAWYFPGKPFLVMIRAQ